MPSSRSWAAGAAGASLVVLFVVLSLQGSEGGEVSAATTPTARPTSTPAPTPTPAPSTGVLARNVVPQPGQVGYRGAFSALKVINGPASAPAGTTWENGMLRVNADNLTLDGVHVKGGLDFYGRGTLTVRNSVVDGGAAWQVLMGRASGCTIDIRDSTLRYVGTPYTGNGAIHGYCTLTAIRNDISGSADGIQVDHGNAVIEQNYIHDLASSGTFHNDGIQFYGGSNIKVRYNRIDIGWNGTNQNGALFFQGSFDAPLLEGNYLSGGGLTLRLEEGVRGAVVHDNVIVAAPRAFGPVLVAPGAVGSWQNNTDGSGAPLDP